MAADDPYSYDYDVALSFAGEDRACAEALAALLKRHGVRVFYDTDEKAELWGKDLYTHLSDVYQHRARFCVMFLSDHYARKVWTNHERRAAQARAFLEHREYILPVRLDETIIPGVLPTIGHLSWPPETAESVTDAVLAKLAAASGPGPQGPSPAIAIAHARSAAAAGEGRSSSSDAKAVPPLIGEISAMRERFLLLFQEHGLPVTVIPTLLSEFGVTLSALEDKGRLADLLSEPLIAHVADLFRVDPAWLRGSSPFLMRRENIPRWYKMPMAFCARVAELYKTSLRVHVHFVKNARTPSRLDVFLNRDLIDIGVIIEREHHPPLASPSRPTNDGRSSRGSTTRRAGSTRACSSSVTRRVTGTGFGPAGRSSRPLPSPN